VSGFSKNLIAHFLTGEPLETPHKFMMKTLLSDRYINVYRLFSPQPPSTEPAEPEPDAVPTATETVAPGQDSVEVSAEVSAEVVAEQVDAPLDETQAPTPVAATPADVAVATSSGWWPWSS
jgi:hypothetical protein